MKKKILLIILLLVMCLGIYLLPKSKTKNTMPLVNENMLSFTVDGTISKTMPTKGSGYIASKIICIKGSIIVFDNDNWTIEVEKLDSEDMCKIDFSKETGSNTVTITINDTSKIDSTSKTTTEGGKVVFYLTEEPDSITGGEHTLTNNKLTVSNVTTNVNLNITMTKTLYDKLLADKTTRLTRTDFSTALTTDNTKTLYKNTEDNKKVYYFAGNATDNWVKFGGYYWRIIRTNSDGGVRLLYHVTSTASTEAYIGTSAFNSSYNNSMYVGYMYGTSGTLESNRTNTNSSTIKTTIDNWYKNNLEAKDYTKYISTTAVYCNDREVGSGTYSSNGGSAFTFSYAAFSRLENNKTPTYDCSNISDKFTVDSSTGNGKLTYPIALMTSDEVFFAGGSPGSVATTYYYYNSKKNSSTNKKYWWTMTPRHWNGKAVSVYIVYGSYDPYGKLSYEIVDEADVQVARPVISLKSCVKYSSGDGSANNPYTILETTSGC